MGQPLRESRWYRRGEDAPGLSGAGFATAAIRLALDYLHGQGNVDIGLLVCVPQAANRRSIRVAEKLGMALERTFVHNGKEVICYAKGNPST